MSKIQEQEILIPEFQELEQLLNCNECKQRSTCNCTIRTMKQKTDCPKISRKVYTIQMVAEIILLVGICLGSYFLFKNFWILLVTACIVCVFNIFIDSALEKKIEEKSFENEKERKRAYKEEVSRIVKENELLKRKKNGESEEYIQFTENILKLTISLEDIIDKIKNQEVQDSKERKRVKEKCGKLMEELNSLNEMMNPKIFQTTYIQTLYCIHLVRLLDNMQEYYNLDLQNKLTDKQIKEFGNLLEAFIQKIANHHEYLYTQQEDDFIIRMKSLNQSVLPESDGSEE
ncbi:MAG: hypothetical protein ACI4UE_00410 [Candidatus Scatovivens sp.]